MMKKFVLIVLSVLCFTVLGCSDDNSSRYIGTWKSIDGAPAILEITKNGDNFIVTQHRVTSNCMVLGRPTPDHCYKLDSKQRPASLQADGTLKIDDFVPAILVYVEKDSTLLANKGAHLMGGTFIQSNDLQKDQFLTILRQME